MKVKITAGSIAAQGRLIGVLGEVVELPDAMALSFINGGLAEKFETPSKKKKITSRSAKINKKS